MFLCCCKKKLKGKNLLKKSSLINGNLNNMYISFNVYIGLALEVFEWCITKALKSHHLDLNLGLSGEIPISSFLLGRES